MNNVEEFDKIASEICELHKQKNLSYGGAFNEVLDELGPNGIYHAVGQIYAKTKRLVSMTAKNDLNTFGESIEDSIKDMVSYGIMTLVSMKKNKKG